MVVILPLDEPVCFEERVTNTQPWEDESFYLESNILSARILPRCGAMFRLTVILNNKTEYYKVIEIFLLM